MASERATRQKSLSEVARSETGLKEEEEALGIFASHFHWWGSLPTHILGPIFFGNG